MHRAIICVDDEKIILDSLLAQLSRNFGDDFDYEVAESASEALEVIEELTEEGVEIMAIVSDWLMPGMKGDELLIHVHSLYPKIRKILLTGQADENAVNHAREQAKLSAVLAKPWEEKELMNLLVAC